MSDYEDEYGYSDYGHNTGEGDYETYDPEAIARGAAEQALGAVAPYLQQQQQAIQATHGDRNPHGTREPG
jgi:hypothetical protein